MKFLCLSRENSKKKQNNNKFFRTFYSTVKQFHLILIPQIKDHHKVVIPPLLHHLMHLLYNRNNDRSLHLDLVLVLVLHDVNHMLMLMSLLPHMMSDPIHQKLENIKKDSIQKFYALHCGVSE